MKMIKNVIQVLRDPDGDFTERKTILMTLIAIIGEFAALVGDIIAGDNIIEILLMIGALTSVPTITVISVWKKKAYIGGCIVAFSLVFMVLPVIFYFGGGIRGGGIIWFAFTYMYVGAVVAGKLRVVLAGILTLETVVDLTLLYFFPNIVIQHTEKMAVFDIAVSVVVVGLIIFSMVWFLSHLFERERERARGEARRAEEAVREQNRFFSSMSHEIRTPINTVLGLNEIILRQEDASDEILRDARNIQGAGKMLLALINDILDVSKIEAGKMDIVPVSYDVSSLVSEIVNMIWLKAEEKGLKFIVNIDPSLPTTLYGDEVRVKQVLINLLNNAVKYTKEGSVTLHMECEKYRGDNVLLKVIVSDTGMGIRSEALPHLFDSFQRVDEEKNRHIEGTGLGLSIVKQLVELMDGEITVDSIYGQGSAFAVTLRQKVENEEEIGNIRIEAGGHLGGANAFEHMFHAPAARVLIVDDNEMNLEVEKKLLDGTEMTVDLALSGAEALKYTVKNNYDVIFLDHLMPEMDGIECYRQIRRQVGGLNKSVPIIVLTANAGGENQELYNTTGFDAHLMKPVSGKQLEEMLLRFLPEDKVNLNTDSEMTQERINTAGGYAKKIPVVITTSSMSDLPEDIRRELQIPIIPFLVYTDHGVFWDGREIVSDELIRYMNIPGTTVASEAPSEEDFMTFFSKQLGRAHHVIHIALTTSMSAEFERATSAARNFENVSIVNSEGLSSATGLLVLCAYRMAQKGVTVTRILEEIEAAKRRIHCSFVIASTDFMARAGHISSGTNTLLKTLWMRPSLHVKKGVFGVEHMMMGSKHRCYEKYIRRALPTHVDPDKELLFVTYADLSEEDLVWIEEKIRKRVDFEHIVFQKASSAISANCGPGTFGLLYMEKGKTDFHLGGFVPEEPEEDVPDEYFEEETESDETAFLPADQTDEEAPEWKAETTENKSVYHSLPGIDADLALKSFGSEDGLKSVMQIFFDSMDGKEKELRKFYEEEDWANYTIKIHALKSSAKLIGATELGKDAEALEMAGKEDRIDYIRENHERVMTDYIAYRDILRDVVDVKEDEEPAEDDSMPVIDADALADAYERIRDLAADCDDMGISDVLEEFDGYRIPDEEKDRVAAIRQAIDNFDFDAVTEVLG
ncbi:MAG: DegV family protein [Eubacterium sp.]|nr:DegV family protein [Eubacterium sp.]